MRRLLVTAAALAACVLVGGAGADGTKVYGVKAGDRVFVTGSHIACFVASHKGVQISCFFVIHNGFVPKTYATVIGENFGAIVKIVKGGGEKLVVLKKDRAGRSARAAAGPVAPTGKTLHIKVGDKFGIAGTHLTCQIEKAQIVGVSCFKVSRQGDPIVGTYAVAANDAKAILLLTTSAKGDFKVVAQKTNFGLR